jgi:multiple sugar transport system permease protein
MKASGRGEYKMATITKPNRITGRLESAVHFFRRLLTSLTFEDLIAKILTITILASGAVVIMIPLIFMVGTSLKDRNQLRMSPPPLLPLAEKRVEVEGKEATVYNVEVDGHMREMALVKNLPGRIGLFVDPSNPAVSIELPLRGQEVVRYIEPHWENYQEALTSVPFDRYMINTIIVVFVGMFGMLVSCTAVAYGFSRFRAPYLNILFLLLLSTIMLPSQVRLIPMYVLFQKIGWVDSLLPLIVPAFFANAYDVFLLRQFFMTIPLEMDDAARIDGANPIQTFIYIILPQSRAALFAVSILHFIWAWNDFYEPLIYLHSRQNWTIAVGLQTFNALYSVNTHLIMAASFVMVIPPIILFLLSQRIFTQGVVVSGVKG